MCGQTQGRALLPHGAETRFSEKTLDHFHVWAPEINLKCLAAIEVGREILFQQNTNILLNSVFFFPTFSVPVPASLGKYLYYFIALPLFGHMSASFNQF